MIGAFVAVWVGSSFVPHGRRRRRTPRDRPSRPVAHRADRRRPGRGRGRLWAAIAGFLKATVGVHEVISTIMLNFVVYCGRAGTRRPGGTAPEPGRQVRSPSPRTSPQAAHLPVFWGDPVLQGLHVGFFIALAAPVVYWLILNRTTLGYEVRATGFNPEAPVRRHQRQAQLRAGDGDLGDVRRARRRDRHPRLAVPPRRPRHPGLADRLHRDRGRAARAQLADRRAARRAALRRPDAGHVDAEPGDLRRDQAASSPGT